MLTPNTYLHCSIMVAKRLQVLGRKKREQKEQADKGGWGGLGQCPNFLQIWSTILTQYGLLPCLLHVHVSVQYYAQYRDVLICYCIGTVQKIITVTQNK